MPKFIDLTGLVFGNWTVVGRCDNAKKQTRWRCRCKCGTVLPVHGGNLRSGLSIQCKPCSNREKASERVTHGMSKSPMFVVWFGMLQRCENHNHVSYKDYGGRGIVVCKRWHRFENFYADMGERPKGATLERKNNDQPYCKSNCEWATRKIQMRNTRANRLLTHEKQTKTLSEWSEETGINVSTIWDRLDNEWPVGEALTRRPGLGKRIH